jgi:hypothetical protein
MSSLSSPCLTATGSFAGICTTFNYNRNSECDSKGRRWDDPHPLGRPARVPPILSYLQWVWNGQIHPGRLQSRCRLLSTEGSAPKEEVSRGQIPRGYPMQEVPVGPDDISGLCLTTATIVPAYQSSSSPICSRMLTFLATVEWSRRLLALLTRFAFSVRRAAFWSRFPEQARESSVSVSRRSCQ